jgi:hypothetical protein
MSGVALPLYWEYSKDIERQGNEMYTSGRSVKSTARKLATGLTVQKATRDARRCVEAHMPGVGATVTSNPSWDFDADKAIISTTVTFPHMHAGISDLRAALHSLPGIRDIRTESSRITITRTV